MTMQSPLPSLKVTEKRMEKPPLSKRDPTIDFLKGFAIILVITIHTSGFLLDIHARTKTFFALIVIDLFAQAAVPLFLFLAGYLEATSFKQKHTSILCFYRKKIIRILPLYFIAASFYYFYFGPVNSYSIASYIKSLIYGSSAYYHLWFIPILLLIYLVTPIMNDLLKERGTSSFFNIGIMAIPVIALLTPIFGVKSYTMFIPVDLLFFFVGFFYKKIYFNKKTLMFIYLSGMSLFLLLVLIWNQYALSRQTFPRPMSVLSIESAMLSLIGLITILTLFRNKDLIYRKFKKFNFIVLGGKLSLEIYLLHAFFVTLISQFLINRGVIPFNFYFVPILFASTYLLSLISSIIIRFFINFLKSQYRHKQLST